MKRAAALVYFCAWPLGLALTVVAGGVALILILWPEVAADTRRQWNNLKGTK